MSSNDVSPTPQETEIADENGAPISRLSWGAIFAGAVCGIAIYVVLSIIGISAGFAVVDPAEDANPLSGIATSAGVWWVVTGLIAFFVGGLVAGRFAGVPRSMAGALHGLTVWAVGVLLLIPLATTTIGGAVTGLAGAAGSLLGGSNDREITITVERNRSNQLGAQRATGNRLQEAGVQESLNMRDTIIGDIRREARQMYRDVVSPTERRQVAEAIQATYADVLKTPGDISQDLRNLYDRLLSNDGILGREDRTEAKRILMQRLGIPDADADQVLSNWEQQYRNAVDELEGTVQNLRNDLQARLGNNSDKLSGGNAEGGENARGVGSVISREQQRRAGRIVRATAQDIIQNPANAVGEIEVMLDRLFSNDGVFTDKDAREAINLIESTTGISESQAERVVDRWQVRYRAAIQEVERAVEAAETAAVEAAQTTTDVVAQVSGWIAFALILAAAAASLGGMLGRPEDWLLVRDELRRVRLPTRGA